jgi:hypothetical protein
MSWYWQYETATGEPATSATQSQAFPNQSEAESWLGESWRGLLEAGVDQVRLREGDREVYGPMSLHPAEQ